MTYNLSHLGSLPVVKNLPAYVDDAVTYLHAVVSIAANEGATTAPSGTRAHMLVRPQGETAWCHWGPVADLTVDVVESALQTCIDDEEEDRVEVSIAWMTDAEAEALPEFVGW